MKRNIGRFQAIPYQMGGEVEEPVMPPQAPSNSPMQKPKNPQIMGAPMADPGMKKGIMGQIAAPKERLTPQSYAGEMSAQKRMKKAPTQSPLGPITGGLKSMGQGMQPQNPAANQPSMGDKWMGEVWQKLTPEEIPGMQEEVARGVGYAEGGDVYTPMSVYNQTMRDLQSGGVAGYAHGGMVEKSQEIASMGRNGDTMLMHIQPGELEGLQSLLGPVTMNPDTGNPEAFAWFAALPFLGKLATMAAAGTAGGAALGGIMGGGEGAKKGALMGLAMGATAGIGAGIGGGAAVPTVAGPKAAAAAGVVPATTNAWALQAPMNISGISPLASTVQAAHAAPTFAQTLGQVGTGASNLAPGSGVLAHGFGGGLTNAQVASAGFGPEAGGVYAGKSGLASMLDNKGTSMALQGLSKATAKPQRQAMGSPPPPQRRRGPMQPPPMPGRAGIEQLRRPGRNLPGNRRIG